MFLKRSLPKCFNRSRPQNHAKASPRGLRSCSSSPKLDSFGGSIFWSQVFNILAKTGDGTISSCHIFNHGLFYLRASRAGSTRFDQVSQNAGSFIVVNKLLARLRPVILPVSEMYFDFCSVFGPRAADFGISRNAQPAAGGYVFFKTPINQNLHATLSKQSLRCSTVKLLDSVAQGTV